MGLVVLVYDGFRLFVSKQFSHSLRTFFFVRAPVVGDVGDVCFCLCVCVCFFVCIRVSGLLLLSRFVVVVVTLSLFLWLAVS
jgi:hypothetical protein